MTSHHVYGSPNRAKRPHFISLMPRPSLVVAPPRQSLLSGGIVILLSLN